MTGNLDFHWRSETSGWLPGASVPASDRGFRHGMALFATLRVHASQSVWPAAHLDTLRAGCDLWRFPAWPENFLAATLALLRSPPLPSGVARLHVTAGDGEPGDPPSASRFFLCFTPRPPPPFPPAGRRLRIRDNPPTLAFGSGAKTHGYWENLEILRLARAAGFDEAVRARPDGETVSACLANLVVLAPDGQWLAPRPESGRRPGLALAWIKARRPVREILLTPEILRDAREIILSSSWSGPVPVLTTDTLRPLARLEADVLAHEFNSHLSQFSTTSP